MKDELSPLLATLRSPENRLCKIPFHSIEKISSNLHPQCSRKYPLKIVNGTASIIFMRKMDMDFIWILSMVLHFLHGSFLMKPSFINVSKVCLTRTSLCLTKKQNMNSIPLITFDFFATPWINSSGSFRFLSYPLLQFI